ncbi:MAG: hypothetical protein KatS3mg108_2818 [Isosphaeraceae bacterium]|nr:MAG: hypothetical protein KatS3mg108_2818 [Isosphaeraceae bacterium]
MRAWDGRSGRVSWKRRGAVVALVALLMPVMVGMLAVGVDFAVVTTARAQMQTACDAAALAGAKSLANEERLRSTVSMVTQIAAAQGNALLLATANRVLGSSPVLKFQTGTAEGADVVVGYLHPDDTTSTRPDPTAPPTWYNSVQVIGRRDPAHGGLVPGFFSGFFWVARVFDPAFGNRDGASVLDQRIPADGIGPGADSADRHAENNVPRHDNRINR